MSPITSLPPSLLLAVINKVDEQTFPKVRRLNIDLYNFVNNNRAFIRVGLFSSYQIQLTTRQIDIHRKKKIPFAEWNNDPRIKSMLIGIRPKTITLRRPVGPEVLDFIKYYHLDSSPIFFHDLPIDAVIPILREINPITIRVSNDKETYDQRLLALPQITTARRVQFDFFLGLHPITHPLLLQNVYEMHIGFTDPVPTAALQSLFFNFWNNSSVIDFLDLFTYVEMPTEIVIRQLLCSVPEDDWEILQDFSELDLALYFPFYSTCERIPYSVARIMQTATSKRGILFVSENRIMFVSK